MQTDPSIPTGEKLRQAMRRWVTGVTIVTSAAGEVRHGMTVNSFVSISLEPPLVTVTMNHDTRTCALVRESGVFAVTILSYPQQPLAELFAGRMGDHGDRLAGLDVFTLVTGAPLLAGGLAYLDCRVVHEHPLLRSTLFIGEVLEAAVGEPQIGEPPVSDPLSSGPLPGKAYLPPEERLPLVYHNRTFTHLG